MGGRTEIQHFSRGQVLEVLQTALEVTTALDPPAELQAAVFSQAAAMLGQKTLQLEQPPPAALGQLAHLLGT